MNTYVNKKTAITVQLNSDNCFLSFFPRALGNEVPRYQC